MVLAGTGSIAYGADHTGRTARAGGYGFLLADEGSGYWLGHQALRAVVRAADGRGPDDPAACRLVFEELEVALGARAGARACTSAACPSTGSPPWRRSCRRPATRGDAVAAELIAQGARELALIARSVARQLDARRRSPYPVVLAGGVFKGCPSLVDPLVAALELPAGPAGAPATWSRRAAR